MLVELVEKLILADPTEKSRATEIADLVNDHWEGESLRHLKHMATSVIFSPTVLFSFTIIIFTNEYEAIYREDSSTDVTNTLRDEHDKNKVLCPQLNRDSLKEMFFHVNIKMYIS